MTRVRRFDPVGLLPLSLAILAYLAVPASVGAAEDAFESPLRAGAWGLEFEIDPVYSSGLGYVGAATISIKRHSSARRAWRLGMAVTFNETESDGQSSFYRIAPSYNPPFIDDATGSADSHSETHAYRLFLHAMRHYPVRERVAVFLEAGPSLRYDEYASASDYLYPYGTPELSSSRVSETRRGASLDATAGFEWFFSKRLSLGARYGAYVSYQWGTRTSTYETLVSDGSYYRRSRDGGDTKRVDVSTTRATVLFTAYL